MTNTSRYLITTADERTWKFDRPVVFLGEWCRHYDRRHIWSRMDAVVAEPYGLGQEQKDEDYARTRVVKDELLLVVRDLLNEFHAVEHSLRYWQIVLGHWLSRYVDVVLNRYHTLEQCLESHSPSETIVLSSDRYYPATLDSLSFIWASNDDVWDNVLGGRVLAFLEVGELKITPRPFDEGPGFRMPRSRGLRSLGSRVKASARRALEALTDPLGRERDALIINSYLPTIEAAKLHLRLGQVPKDRRSPSPIACEPDPKLRERFADRISQADHRGFATCVRALLFELLPTCYLEGFAGIQAQTRELRWPKRPHFIFTSNNFDTDELFKSWTAQKIEDGAHYYVGQHGNNYGTHRYMLPTVEETTADKFLTWGWTDGLPQHVSAFIFTRSQDGRRTSYDQNGAVLLIEVRANHRITTWDGSADFIRYFNDQITFVERLDSAARGLLIIRLHQEYRKHHWSERSRWLATDPDLRVDEGSRRIEELIKGSRLVIHSYDSTGMLETLAQNIPTMAFWQDGFSHLRESAKPYYQLLVDAGIVHLSPDSVAHKANEVLGDVARWWDSDDVQLARATFCHRYARTSDQPVSDLGKILLATR